MQVQNVGIGEKYLAVRRHTVGPGDTAHEQVRSYFLNGQMINFKYLERLPVPY